MSSAERALAAIEHHDAALLEVLQMSTQTEGEWADYYRNAALQHDQLAWHWGSVTKLGLSGGAVAELLRLAAWEAGQHHRGEADRFREMAWKKRHGAK